MQRLILSIIESSNDNANSQAIPLLANNYLLSSSKGTDEFIKRRAIAVLAKKLQKLCDKHQDIDNFDKEKDEIHQTLSPELFADLYNAQTESSLNIP